ncbi:MAG TPA: hypothetical protein VID50_10220 [Candidatus Eisenbacteria bacterium]
MRHRTTPASRLPFFLLGLVLSAAVLAADRSSREPRFTDAGSQAAEFIGYSSSIRLTQAQQKQRDRALEKIPAPCCSKFSSRTCCCPCNLAKSVWGLSNFVIARQGGGDAELERAVRAWIRFVNPGGFSGTTCDTAGGCGRRFSQNGCGGMNERVLEAAR